jgi:hypothetical protein
MKRRAPTVTVSQHNQDNSDAKPVGSSGIGTQSDVGVRSNAPESTAPTEDRGTNSHGNNVKPSPQSEDQVLSELPWRIMPNPADIAAKADGLTEDIPEQTQPAESLGSRQLVEKRATHKERPTPPVSEASETSTGGRERPRQKFRRLRRMRTDILGLRSRLEEERKALKYEADSLNRQEEAMLLNMQATIQSKDTTRADLTMSQWKDIQEARDKRRLGAEAYNESEDILNRREWDMKELESHLYREGASADISDADGDFGLLGIASEPTSSSLSAHSGPIVTSPRVSAYLSRRGDVGLLQERLAELQSEQARLDQDIQTIQEELVQAEDDVRRMHEALPEKEDAIPAIDEIEGEEAEWDPINRFLVHDSPPLLDIGDPAVLPWREGQAQSESNFLGVHDQPPLNPEYSSQKTEDKINTSYH